jgi:hypothetical protein
MYAEALSLLDAEGPKETYERAYTLYRLQRENEARDILENMKKRGKDDRGTAHLEAQLVLSIASRGFLHLSPVVSTIEKASTRRLLTCTTNFLTRQSL